MPRRLVSVLVRSLTFENVRQAKVVMTNLIAVSHSRARPHGSE